MIGANDVITFAASMPSGSRGSGQLSFDSDIFIFKTQAMTMSAKHTAAKGQSEHHTEAAEVTVWRYNMRIGLAGRRAIRLSQTSGSRR